MLVILVIMAQKFKSVYRDQGDISDNRNRDRESSPLGPRLHLARMKAGLSLRKLADATQGKASHETIRQFENGLKIPDEETLETLCRVLEVTRDYLLAPQELTLGEIEFRKTARTTSADRATVRHELLDVLERYLEVEDLLELDHPWIPPALKVTCSNQDPAYAEEMALALREHWKLGLAPIHDFTKLLEEKGLKVLQPHANVESISGLTCEVHRAGRPSVFVIVVNRHQSLERRRFTMGHELAHRLLDLEGLNGKAAESLCNRFAAAFLVPKETLVQEMGSRVRVPTYREIVLVKKFFRVSAAMLITRLEQVGLMETAQKNIYFHTVAHGWRGVEPEPLQSDSIETPRFERLVYRALSYGFISNEKAAELLRVPVPEVEHNLRAGWVPE